MQTSRSGAPPSIGSKPSPIGSWFPDTAPSIARVGASPRRATGWSGSSLRYAAQKTIADVVSEVSKNRADYGVVPVENSTEGVVTHTLDMLAESVNSQLADAGL